MLIFADPCGLIYSSTAQAVAGLWQAMGSATISTSGLPAGNIGSTAIRIPGPNQCNVSVPNTPGPYFIGMRVCFTSVLSEQEICRFRDPTTGVQTSFFTEANGTITAWRGGGTLIGTSSLSTTLAQNVWSYLELELSIDASVGIVGVHINGNNVLNTTANTKGSGSSGNIGNIAIGSNLNPYIQDVYICDSTGSRNNTFLGDIHVSAYNANGAGSFSAYTPNGAATIWQSVSAITPTDSTVFASDSTPGDRMSTTVATTSVAGTIAGVIGVSRMLKTDAGTRTAALTITNSGSDLIGSSVALGTSYAYSTLVAETDPGSGLPWTTGGFNTAQPGV